ncbi:MAG: JDVT-CTERM domain-containing protein [Thiohalomonadales bacterium]
MKTTKLKTMKMLKQGLVLSALVAASTQLSAQTVYLCAGTTTKVMPDTSTIVMWGYGLDTATTVSGAPCAATVPGPEITVLDTDPNLTINLRNTLLESVSVMIPGLTSTVVSAPVRATNGRVRSFTHETPAASLTADGTGVYSFNAKAGTYLYQSGTHIAKQVQMGLYGTAIKNNTALVPAVAGTPTVPAVAAIPATAYPGVSYDKSITLLYSEIDPLLHAAVANGTYGTPAFSSTINFKPRYFMVNGNVFTATTPKVDAGPAKTTVLFRMLNAGLETHVPVFNGQYVDIQAEYGNKYPFPKTQYSVMLPAGQTRDATMTAQAAGDVVIYDRRLRLTNNADAGAGGMYSVLSVSAPIVALNSLAAGNSGGFLGGGCTLQADSRFDPMLPLLLLLSGLFFIRHKRLKR